jgi:hypothetical protein
MIVRRLPSFLAALMVLALAAGYLFGQAATKPAPAASKAYNPPRTPDGQPDLTGVWSNSTTTPLERPANLGAKEFYTPEELAANANRPRGGGRGAPREDGQLAVHYDLSQFGLDKREVAPNLRTSLIVGPEGRIPPRSDQAKQRAAAKAAFQREHGFDGPDTRALSERCILWPNEGPPMLSPGYNSNLQIVQGPGFVAVMQEMIHDVRMIPIDGRPHVDSSVRQLMGDSRGHCEGNTLVVDTTNFTNRTAFQGSSDKLHVVEKFTRTDAETILYQFTVEDPETWAKPWSAEVPWTKSATERIFEYACQEGNYGMANILSGVRATEAKEAAKQAAAAAAAK